VAGLLAHRLPAGSETCFPSFAGQTEVSRSAWCYGDPGIASSLLAAGRATARTDWEDIAMEVALAAADRPVDRAGVVDASLCHGSVGLAHLFNRFYQATGHPRFLAAAREWLRRTLAFRGPADRPAAFQFLVPVEDG